MKNDEIRKLFDAMGARMDALIVRLCSVEHTIEQKAKAPCKEKKPIKFVSYIEDVVHLDDDGIRPGAWDHVELLWHDSNRFDIIKAWDDGKEEEACIYLGHWNDGVKE